MLDVRSGFIGTPPRLDCQQISDVWHVDHRTLAHAVRKLLEFSLDDLVEKVRKAVVKTPLLVEIRVDSWKKQNNYVFDKLFSRTNK